MITLPKPPKTIVLGMDGFLGRHFYDAYKAFHPDTVGTSNKTARKNLFLDLAQIDVSILPLEESGYTDALITAGITKISHCEEEKEYTRMINVDGILELARRMSEAGLKVIWFSSDYVFDGRSGNYSESSPTHPVNEYGRQKAEVEKRLSKICKGNALIVRLSKLFGLKKGDGHLIDNMAYKLMSGDKINAAYDQFFCPTLVDDVVRVVFQLQSRSINGLINLCNPKMWSRYDLAIQVCNAWYFSKPHIIG